MKSVSGDCAKWRPCSLALAVSGALTLLACNGGPAETAPTPVGTIRHRAEIDDATRYIELRRQKVEAIGTRLGAATSPVTAVPKASAYYVTFSTGAIVWSNAYGAVVLTEQLFLKWLSLATQLTPAFNSNPPDLTDVLSIVGPPRSDYIDTNRFDSVSTVYLKSGQIVADGPVSRVIYGDIYSRYAAYEIYTKAGLPTSEVATSIRPGTYQVFENGEIHAHPQYGVRFLSGPILERWHALGGAAGKLGFPTEDTAKLDATGGERGQFSGGTIYSDGTTAWEIASPLAAAYEGKHGGPSGWLGFPIGAPGAAVPSPDIFPDGATGALFEYQDFQGGLLVNYKGADGSSKGIYTFGTLEFFLGRILAFGDCGTCGSADLYAYGYVYKNGELIYQDRFPREGDYDDDARDVNVPVPLGTAHSTTTVDVTVSVYDADLTTGNDHLGYVRGAFSINNLWGATLGTYHEASTGKAAATFDVKEHHDYDSTNFRQSMYWSFDNYSGFIRSDGTVADKLPWSVFADTFADVGRDEHWWTDPFNSLWFLAYQGITKTGNCFGMNVESMYAQTGKSLYAEPIFDKYFPETATGLLELPDVSPLTPAHIDLSREINIKHGYQAGGSAVRWAVDTFVHGNTGDPRTTYYQARDFNATGDFPQLIMMGKLFTKVHSVRAYAFTEGESCVTGEPTGCARIWVADGNFPAGNPTKPTLGGGKYNNYIEFDLFRNSFRYVGQKAYLRTDEWDLHGDRIFVMPYHLFSSQPETPFLELVLALGKGIALLYVIGDEGQTQQITDDQGRTFFKPGLSGPGTDWSDLQDDALRIPNLAPVPSIGSDESDEGSQIFAGRGTGTTYFYDVALRAEQPAGTAVKVSLNTSTLSSAFSIPGVAGKPDRIGIERIGTAEERISFEVPADSTSKQITWTVGGGRKKRWARCDNLSVAPGQRVTIRLTNGGFNPIFENTGPTTACDLTVNQDAGGSDVHVGSVEIGAGPSSTPLQFQLPVTKIALANVTFGANNWITAPVTVNLTAKDFSGLGMMEVNYGQDGIVWTRVIGDSQASLQYANEGATVLYFRSIDVAGNVEEPKAQDFTIDTRAPTVSATVDASVVTRVDPFLVHFGVSDPAPGSGIDTFAATLDGQPVSQGQSVDLLWFPLGTHVIGITATDRAGWTSSGSATFELTATLDSLGKTVAELELRGEITSGTSNDLSKVLQAAAASQARGNAAAAVRQLTAISTQITSLSGKQVSTKAANLLNSDIAYVIAHVV